jgi:hypothetical protein
MDCCRRHQIVYLCLFSQTFPARFSTRFAQSLDEDSFDMNLVFKSKARIRGRDTQDLTEMRP